jgi:hypothetical protein
MGKIFANSSLDERLISRIYKEFQKLNTQRKTTQLTNGQTVLKKEAQMTNKYMNKCPTFLDTRTCK